MALGQAAQIIPIEQFYTSIPSKKDSEIFKNRTSFDHSEQIYSINEIKSILDIIKSIPDDKINDFMKYLSNLSQPESYGLDENIIIESHPPVSAAQHNKNIQLLNKFQSIKPIIDNEINPED